MTEESPRFSINEALVHDAADRLLKDGIKPTQRAVLEAVGSGSMSTVNRYMATWRKKRADEKKLIEEHADLVASAGAKLSEPMRVILDQAKELAAAEFDEERQRLTEGAETAIEDAKLARQEAKAAQNEAETAKDKAAALESLGSELREELSHQAKAHGEALAAMQQRLEVATSENGSLRERNADLAQSNANFEADLAQLRLDSKAALEKSRESYDADVARHLKSVDDLKSAHKTTVTNLGGQIKAQAKTITALEKRVTTLLRDASEQERKLGAATGRASAQSETIDKLMTRIADLETQLLDNEKAASAKLAEVERARIDRGHELAEARREIKALQQAAKKKTKS